MNTSHKLSIYTVLLALLVTACAAPRTADYLAESFKKPEKIAVLPISNQTTDIEAGEVLRTLTHNTLFSYQYATILDMAETDSLLRLEGLTDGGQLSMVEQAELMKILDVDGLLYIDLVEARYNTVGVKETKIVHAKYQLYGPAGKLYELDEKTDNGQSLFEGIYEIASDPTGALKDRAMDTVVKGIKGALTEHNLLQEMTMNVNTMFATLPQY